MPRSAFPPFPSSDPVAIGLTTIVISLLARLEGRGVLQRGESQALVDTALLRLEKDAKLRGKQFDETRKFLEALLGVLGDDGPPTRT